MATISRIPATQDQLKSLLQARAGLSGVQITIGEPSDPRPREYLVISGFVTDETQEVQTLHPFYALERFTQQIHVVVQQTGNYALARDRAFVLAAEAETELRNNQTLTNVDWDVALAGLESGEILEEEFRAVVITLKLAVQAQLGP